MQQISIQYHKTVFGELILGSFEGQLCLADWRYRRMRARIDTRMTRGLNAVYVEQSSPTIQQCIQQFQEYSQGNREVFDVPLLTVGTPFQKQVWAALVQIPYGQTMTYLALATLMGNPKAVRAVAGANGANAISIMIPCHRIIGSNGSLVGYAGGLGSKRKLLAIERSLTLDLGL